MTSRCINFGTSLIATTIIAVLAAAPSSSRANSLLNLQVQEPKVAVYGVYVD